MSPEAALSLATALAANAVRRQGLIPLAQAQQKVAAGVQPSIDEEMAESGADCKPGCCWCCHRPIPLTILEAAAIVEHIIANWPDERQRELNEKLRSYEIETRFKRADPLETIRVQCPFLSDGLCSIYEVRPWMCRSQASKNAEDCKNWKENPYERVPISDPGILGPPGKFKALRITKRPRIDSCDAFGEAVLDGILKGTASASVQTGFLELGLAIRPQLAKSAGLSDIPYDSDTNIAAWLEGFHPRLGEPIGICTIDPQVDEAMERWRNIPPRQRPMPFSGMDPQLALSMLQLPICPGSEDEILDARAHYEKVLDHLLDIHLDSKAVFDALDTHVAITLPYFGFVDRDLNAKYGSFVDRHATRALPDLTQALQRKKPHTKLRVGFISGTLWNHNGSRWALGFLLHTPANVETFALQLGSKEDFATEIWRARSDHFYGLRGPVPEAARFIKSLELDVLIYPDPTEFLTNAKQYAALKLAPIQAAMWGTPCTTGFANMTHYLSSDAMEPENGQDHYSETLVRLPRSGLCYESWFASDAGHFDKSLLGEGPHFLIAQNPMKILPRRDALLKRVCEEIGRPLLAIQGDNLATVLLKERFERKGIPVQWIPQLDAMEFAGLLAAVDASLDVPDWSGGNSTLQSLLVGTPVISLPGMHMRGRHTLGFYKIIGGEALMAADEDDYVAKAKSAATMRENLKNLPVGDLFDDVETSGHFFEALRLLSCSEKSL